MDSSTQTPLIEDALHCRRVVVAGATDNPAKFGYDVYRALKAAGYRVFALNPNADTVDGDPAYPALDNLPEPAELIVTVTQPPVTEQLAREAHRAGISIIWMQEGSESTAAVREAEANGLRVIHGGPCVLTELHRTRSES
jgi:predicted CoA-binding protein